MTPCKRPLAAVAQWSAVALVCWLGATACDNRPETVETPGETFTAVLTEIESPDGGAVKQLTLAGPEGSTLVTCDQEGFAPFTYSDMGLEWIGCQVPNPGDAVGPASSLTEPTLAEVPSPVGGTVQQLTLPGPQSGVVVTCAEGFAPFIYEDQGTWVGCQASP
ncbi:MAG TPA: hypothetical protein IGR64_12510 [Leptolyngbyaceae cyanobacterium M65_K2018_010]|nr:hypothetical protein [Leptolyngbyaceae cyanobacterium M65_K2018_010]